MDIASLPSAVQACLAQLAGPTDEERYVGLLMLTKVLPPDSLTDAADPQQAALRSIVFGAVGDEFLKRMLKTADDDGAHRNFALSIISLFVVDADVARRFRSAVPIFLKCMRACDDAAVLRDAVACFAGVLRSNIDISAAGYGKCVASLVAAAAVFAKAGEALMPVKPARCGGSGSRGSAASAPGGGGSYDNGTSSAHVEEDSDGQEAGEGDSDEVDRRGVLHKTSIPELPVEAAALSQQACACMDMACTIVQRWESSGKSSRGDGTHNEAVVGALTTLATSCKLPDVSLAALRLWIDVVSSTVTRTAWLLPPSHSSHAAAAAAAAGLQLRGVVKSALRVYGSQAHVDSGLWLAAEVLEHAPPQWSAEPQFALLVLRQAGIELKLLADDLESALAHSQVATSAVGGGGGGSSASNAPESDEQQQQQQQRARHMLGVCGRVIDAVVSHLVSTSAEDDAALDAAVEAAPATTSSAPQTDTPQMSPERLAELLLSSKGSSSSTSTDSAEYSARFEADKAAAAAAKAREEAQRREALTRVYGRWFDFPGEVMLHLRASLQDIMRVLLGFLEVVNTYCVGAATAATVEPIEPSTTTTTSLMLLSLPWLREVCVAMTRMVGRYCAEDADSFESELLAVLPLCMRVCATTTSLHSNDQPQCLRQGVCYLLPTLLLRTSEPHFLLAFADMGCPEVLATWCVSACKALAVTLMDCKRAMRSAGGEPPLQSTSQHLHELVPLLSMAATVMLNVTALLPSFAASPDAHPVDPSLTNPSPRRLRDRVFPSTSPSASPWLACVRSVCTIGVTLLQRAPAGPRTLLGCLPGEVADELSSTLMTWACVSLHVARCVDGGAAGLSRACAAAGGSAADTPAVLGSFIALVKHTLFPSQGSEYSSATLGHGEDDDDDADEPGDMLDVRHMLARVLEDVTPALGSLWCQRR